MGSLGLQTRVKILRKIASDLAANEQLIIDRNSRDVASAERKKLDPTLLQRLRMKPEKIRTLVRGIQAIADQEEPLRKVWEQYSSPAGVSRQELRLVFDGHLGTIASRISCNHLVKHFIVAQPLRLQQHAAIVMEI